MPTLCCAGNIADAADTFVTMGEFLEQVSTMKEFAHLGQMFEWRHAFRRLQPPALPGAVAEQELVPIQPDAALEAIVGFRKDSAEKLGSRLDEQLVRNQQRKHRVGGRTRTVSKAEARRKGEVTWEMFVMVLQSSDDMNERCVRHLCRLETAWLLSPLILVCADCSCASLPLSGTSAKAQSASSAPAAIPMPELTRRCSCEQRGGDQDSDALADLAGGAAGVEAQGARAAAGGAEGGEEGQGQEGQKDQGVSRIEYDRRRFHWTHSYERLRRASDEISSVSISEPS